MITQTIKHWLRKMFAWWPWKQPEQTTYADAPGPPQQGALDRLHSHSAIDGSASQAGGAPRRAAPDGWPGQFIPPAAPSPPGEPAASLPPYPQTSASSSHEPPGSSAPHSEAQHATPVDMQERNLEFLRYLVQRGLINEGFEKEQTPEQ